MDGNGNNSSKVSTLRQHFENYDKIEQRKPSVVAATIFQNPQSVASLVSTKSVDTSKVKSATSGQLYGETTSAASTTTGSTNRNRNTAADSVSGSVSRSKTSSDIKSFAHGLVDNSLSANLQRSASEKDLLMSASLAAATKEGCSRRNGIYISNSLRFEEEERSGSSSLETRKRRGVVMLDEDMMRVHHRHIRRSPMDDDDDDEGEEDDDLDVDDVEHDDDPAVETSIPLPFDRHDEVLGDGSSITSNSTTSSHNSFHGFSSSTKNKHGNNSLLGNPNNNHSSRNAGCIGEEVDNRHEKGLISSNAVAAASAANNHDSSNNIAGGGMRDSGSKANTPTSSSSCSSGSGACGKVKRRNAFRHKDISSFPTAAAAGDGSSSAVLAAVAKTKVAVERVKSLDSATSNATSSSSGIQNNSINSTLLNSRKSVSSRGDPVLDSPNNSGNYNNRSVNNNSNNQMGKEMSAAPAGDMVGSASESRKNNNNIVLSGGMTPHELMVANNTTTSNTGGGGGNSKSSPAQRAASLCVRTNNQNNNNNSKSPQRASQMYEPSGNSAFARNNGSSNNQPPHNMQHHHHPHAQQLHHQMYQQQQNCNTNNNHHILGNAPDNHSNNSINHNNNNNNNSNNGSSQRVVHVVTPYQVTDIYNQLKISDSLSSPAYPNGANNNASNNNNMSKQPQQLKQMLNEVEYAVPMVQSVQHQQQHRYSQQQAPSKKPSPPATMAPVEIPPKVPPPPLNYPPSSIRKEQFGLPSPNSSYSFLPHRNSQGMLSSNMPKPVPYSTNNNKGNAVGRNDAVVASASTRTKDSKKGAVGPPEKPPRTFLYNQAPSSGSQLTRHAQQVQYTKQKQEPQSANKAVHGKRATTTRGNTDFYNANNNGSSSTNSPPTKGQASSNGSSSNLNSSSSGSSIGGGSSTAGAIGLPSLSQAKRQHSSSSSSSTLTSGTAATIVNNYRQQMSPSSSFKTKEPSSSTPNCSTATVRQTNVSNAITTNTPALQRKTMDALDQSEGVYVSNRNGSKKRMENNNANGTKGGTAESSRTPKASSSSHRQSQGSHNGSSAKTHHHHHHHHHIHPPLVRSKTESQLVVKSKSGANRFLNRPSDGALDYGMEMTSLEPGRQHSHYHQDLLVDATHPNATLSQMAPSGAASSYYASSGPPVHHQSQTNLLTLTSNKIYEQQQYRSISNLLRYANHNSGTGAHYNKYPSNPGLHYASRELSWLDNGLPPVSSMTNAGSNYNLYSSGGGSGGGGDNPRHTSLLYTTNIDISADDRSPPRVKQSVRQALTFNDSSPVVDLLQQQNSLYATRNSSDNQNSVHHHLHHSQLRNNGSQFNGNHLYGQHPLYQFRLSERSKSEWALNAVQNTTGGVSSNVNSTNQFRSNVSNNSGNNAFGFTSTTSTTSSTSSHRQLTSSNNRINMIGSNNAGNNGCDGSNPCPSSHIASRRATVAIAGSSSGGAASLNSAGHPSLDSTPHHPNNGGKRQNPGGGPNSIQHLVNQLFSTSTIKEATSSTDSGIQLGSESLSSCDTPIGDSTTDTGDSDCENEGDTSNNAREVVEARKGYVRRVSSVRVQELGESLHRLIQSSKIPHNADPLFECLLVVGLDRDPKNGIYHPYITEKFPRDAKLAEGVEEFCFPDSYEWPCHEGSTAQFYTLAITDQRGGRKFGCCFRILPEGATFCIPITYCIISSHRAIGFYREVLREITACHGYSEYQRRHFLQELYKKSFPNPGSSITLMEPTIEETYIQNDHVGYGSLTGSPPKTVTIRRRADHRLDEGDLVTLVSTVDLSIVIKLFGSLLLERKVVLLSRALSTLSLCVEALESLLYPFNWQHTFVPILPLNMPDVIDAPAPFLIGVLRSSRTAWDKTLDDGIVVDLDADNGKIISCVGDEGTILPKRIHRKLRNALSQLVLDLADQKDSTKNVLISECFIRMFVETLGHYSNHIVTKPDGTRVFERDGFVKAAESKAIQNFLEWFSETSMFNEFIEMKLKNTQQHGLFEQRVMEQIESGPIIHGGSNSGTPLKKDLWIKMKGPFGTWLKETFK